MRAGKDVRMDFPGVPEVVHVSVSSKQAHALVGEAGPARGGDVGCDRIHGVHGVDVAELLVVDEHLFTGRACVVVVESVAVLDPSLLIEGGQRKGVGRPREALWVTEGDVLDLLVFRVVTPHPANDQVEGLRRDVDAIDISRREWADLSLGAKVTLYSCA